MFKRLEDSPTELVTLTIDGQTVQVPKGESVAAAVLAHSPGPTRTTPVSGSPRAPYCMMGSCFECLMVIDGQTNRQACLRTVREGMRIERQRGSGGTKE